MNPKIKILVFCILSYSASSQKFAGVAKYTFTFKGKSQSNQLFFDTNTSQYVFNSIDSFDTLKISKNENTDSNFSVSQRHDKIGDIYYKDLRKRIFKGRVQVINKAYLYDEINSTMAWELKDDQKQIGNYTCQKAIVSFRGRDYEAWFANAIPVSSGPWKFHGLPGLILEVRDKTNDISFVIDQIKFLSDVKIIFPENGKKITFDDYKVIWIKTLEDIKDKALTMMEDKGVTIELKIDDDGSMEINFDNE